MISIGMIAAIGMAVVGSILFGFGTVSWLIVIAAKGDPASKLELYERVYSMWRTAALLTIAACMLADQAPQ